MNVFQIKLIAVITMAIDHIGLFFFPDMPIFRAVGRLAFPLFAWLIANGAFNTRDIYSYLKRLFIFAIASQVPFILAFRELNPSYWSLNIFFTLSLGLASIVAIRDVKPKPSGILLAGLFVALAWYFDASYGAAGVLSIIVFYLFFDNIKKMFLGHVLIYTAFNVIPTYLSIKTATTPITTAHLMPFLQPLALFSLVFIAFYNGKEGPSAKYFFYPFYPLHLFIIYLILVFAG
jgi:hypothetical protein